MTSPDHPQILVVDDTRENLTATLQTLGRGGYTCIGAETGTEAIELARTIPVDLVLLDIILPDRHGIEVCKQIKSDLELEDIYVILYSGAEITSEQRAAGLEAGADDYIARPVSNRELQARVQAGLRVKNAEESLTRETAKLAALQAINLEIAAELDLEKLLQSIVSKAVELLAGTAGGIALYQPDLDCLQYSIYAGIASVPQNTYIQRGEGFSGQIWETGEPLIISDYSNWEGHLPHWVEYLGSRADVGVPVCSGSDFLGVLDVFADPPRKFTPENAELLSLFANHAAIAIRNAQLYEAANCEILECKRVEITLRESEARYRALFNDSPTAVAVSKDGTYLYVNWACAQMFGFDHPDEMKGTSLIDRLPPGSREKVRNYNLTRERGEQVPSRYGISGLRRDGTEFPMDVTVTTLQLNDEIVTYAFVQDITRLKQTQDELHQYREHLEGLVVERTQKLDQLNRKLRSEIDDRIQIESRLKVSEERYRNLVEGAPDIVYAFSLQTGGLFYSQGVESILGYSPEYLLENPMLWKQSIHPDDQEKIIKVIELVANRENFDIEYRIKNAQGKWLWFRDRSFGIRTEDQSLIVEGIATEITQRKRAEKAEHDMRVRAQALSQRIGEIQEIERRRIAHELHDEIGQELTGLNLLLDTGLNQPSLLAQSIRNAQEIAIELLDKVHELSLDLRPTLLDDLGLLPTLNWHFQRYAERMKIQVDFDHRNLNQRFSPAVEIAAYRIVQEALTNVARHAKVDQVAVQLWVADRQTHIQIEDRGVGFDHEAVLQSTTAGGIIGMRERVTWLGGQFEIGSSPGDGTTIMANLPIDVLGDENDYER